MLHRKNIPPDNDGDNRTNKGKTRLAFIFIVLAVFLCFAPALRNDFVSTWDDGGYIVENEHIRSLSPETISWAFFSVHANYWAPLTWLSLALDHAFWGLDPLGYHLTNNILHALNAGLFFLLSLQLLQIYGTVRHTEEKSVFPGSFNQAFYCSLLAALFFAVHPLRVESVAWATERKDVLSLFFGIPAVLAYVKYSQSGKKNPGSLSFAFSRYYWFAVGLFCFSLLGKSTLVTLPFVLLVLDWFPLDRLKRSGVKSLLLEKALFMLIAVATSVIILFAHQSVTMPFTEAGISSRILIALRSIMSYLWFTAWPLHLSPFYLHPGNVDFLSLEYAIPVLFFLVVTASAVLLVKRTPVLMAVWLIYLITLLPVLGFAQVSNTIMSDRFTYIPSMPISILIALALTQLVAKLSGSRPKYVLLLSAIASLLIVNIYLTVRQLSFWKDDVALWSRAIDIAPKFSGRTYFMRATSYIMKGEYEKALTDMNEAIAIAERRKRPQMHDLYLERARVFAHLGKYNEAIADYTRALQTDLSAGRSVYYRERGQLYKEQGRLSLANEDFRSSASLSGLK